MQLKLPGIEAVVAPAVPRRRCRPDGSHQEGEEGRGGGREVSQWSVDQESVESSEPRAVPAACGVCYTESTVH